jgi:F-type H+-transporting ATPase subunit delta
VSTETLAERYARAIFDLGVESGNPSALVEEFRRLAEVYGQSKELEQVMGSPVVPEQARLATMIELADRVGVSPLTKSALGVMTHRRRMFALPAIAAELNRLSDETSGIVRITVVSAERLPDSYRERLIEELASMTGKKVVLDQKLDPELLAGVVVRIGDRVIDGSARTRLSELRLQLLGH